MLDFFKNRAGKQLAVLMSGSTLLWIIGYVLHRTIFGSLSRFDADTIDILFLTFILLGGASFIYSLLRILDLRKEMQRQAEQGKRAHWIATHDHLTLLPKIGRAHV